MILVTGATGTIGREVVRLLVERDVPLRAMTRADVLSVETVHADFGDPSSLRAAVDGARSVFLLTAPGAWIPEHDLAMIDAARTSGVRKIVKLSAVGGDRGATPAAWHAPGEQALAAGDLAWSVLRPSSFASNALRWAPMVQAGKPVPNMTGTGTQGVVDPRDVAAVAVEALLTDDLDGAAHTLTGPDLLDVPTQVAQLAELLERSIETVDVPLEAMREHLLASGLDPSVVEVAVHGSQLVRDGGNALVTGDVEDILGRPARTFRTWAADHLDAFVTRASSRP